MKTLGLEITREPSGEVQTLGHLKVIDVCGETVFSCKTLELAWKDNRPRVSCIPKGRYKVSKYNSPTKGKVFLLHDVPGRSYIEIHTGNYHTDVVGCILVGSAFQDINYDGLQDVVNSRATLNKLLAMMPDEFELNIK